MSIIYKATHISTGMCYIGLTTTTLEQRVHSHLSDVKRGSNTKFHNAIREFGEQSFIWETLHQNVPKEFIQQLEEIEICIHNSKDFGFNSTNGGEPCAIDKTDFIPYELIPEIYDLHILQCFPQYETAKKLRGKHPKISSILKVFKTSQWQEYLREKGDPLTDFQKFHVKALRKNIYPFPIDLESLKSYLYLTPSQVRAKIEEMTGIEIPRSQIANFLNGTLWKKFEREFKDNLS